MLASISLSDPGQTFARDGLAHPRVNGARVFSSPLRFEVAAPLLVPAASRGDLCRSERTFESSSRRIHLSTSHLTGMLLPMASTSELLELLEHADPGREDLGPGTDEDEDRYSRINWAAVTPRRAPTDVGESDWDLYGDEWHPDFPQEWVEALGEALQSGQAPAGPEAPCGDKSYASHRCAWYVPLHLSPSGFGIYIRERCVLERALRIGSRLRGTRPSPILQKALYRAGTYQLFLHEQFHHKIESFGFRLVVVEGKLRYADYEARVYRKVLGTNSCIEEAMANADAHRRLGESTYANWIGPSIVNASRQTQEASWRRSPPGYSQAGNFLTASSYYDGLALLKAQVHEATLHPRRVSPWRVRANMAESMFRITSHIYTVYPVGATPLLPIR